MLVFFRISIRQTPMKDQPTVIVVLTLSYPSLSSSAEGPCVDSDSHVPSVRNPSRCDASPYKADGIRHLDSFSSGPTQRVLKNAAGCVPCLRRSGFAQAGHHVAVLNTPPYPPLVQAAVAFPSRGLRTGLGGPCCTRPHFSALSPGPS
jgi:hypothetical protein